MKKSYSKILGIDPGVGRTGFGILENNASISLIDYGVITSPKGERGARLFILHREILRLIEAHKPHLLALERLFFNKNIQTAMAVGEAIGVILLAAEESRLPIREYTPQEIKQVVVGSGRAKKHEVKGMIEILLNQKIKGPDDAADALAVAFCHLSCEALGE